MALTKLIIYLAANQDSTDGPLPNGDDSPEANIAKGVVSVSEPVAWKRPRADYVFRSFSANRGAQIIRYAMITFRGVCALVNICLEGEEVLHLPVIVDAAESSPTAAQEAANRIRKFLSKDNFQRPYVQYNAIMLVRILADNPGKSFTKNLDAKFVATVKDLLRDGRDMSVQQILRETLDSFEIQKPEDETLAPLREMWKKEKQKLEKWAGPVCQAVWPISTL